jgi:hypothetical protein
MTWCRIAIALLFEYVITREIAIQLSLGSDYEDFARKHQLVHLGLIAGLTDYHLFEETEHTVTDPELHGHPGRSIDVLWWEHQDKRQLIRRGDPDYREQWHLHDPKVGLAVPGAWELGYTGAGVRISVLDDGIESEHPEFAGRYLPELSYDINGHRQVHLLGPFDIHGTAAAGLSSGAARNGHCGAGVAPDSLIASVRMISSPTSDAEEAQGIAIGLSSIDVYSASWGPPDDARRLEGPGHLAREVLEAAVNGSPLRKGLHARGGKGAIYVWASGNGGKYGDNCNYDGWSNSRYTVAVSSVTDSGLSPDYAEDCAALITSAPSSGGTKGIHTADLSGLKGYDAGECTSRFRGTSASAPMVAGVVALALQANSELGWRDVQHILVHASQPLSSDSAQRNGAGLYYSHRFGFGLLNATTAVRLAIGWNPVEPATELVYTQIETRFIYPKELIATRNVSESIHLEHVAVVFSALHPRRGQLSVRLTSPSGTVSRLADQHPDVAPDYVEWTFFSTACWGEDSLGIWSLTVTDAGQQRESTLVSWTLKLWGTVK